MPKDKKEWIKFLRTENDYMTYLLEAFEVPETVDGKWFFDEIIKCTCYSN